MLTATVGFLLGLLLGLLLTAYVIAGYQRILQQVTTQRDLARRVAQIADEQARCYGAELQDAYRSLDMTLEELDTEQAPRP